MEKEPIILGALGLGLALLPRVMTPTGVRPMGAVDDEFMNITINKILAAAKADLIGYDAPTSAKVGTTVTVKGYIQNIGDAAYTCYFVVYEPSTNTIFGRNEIWLDVLERQWFTVTLTMPDRNLNLQLIAGHYTP